MRAAAASHGRTYLTASADAQPVQVFRSSAPDPAADQALVDFLGTLVHGSELGALRVQVGRSRRDQRELRGWQGRGLLRRRREVGCMYPTRPSREHLSSMCWRTSTDTTSRHGVPMRHGRPLTGGRSTGRAQCACAHTSMRASSSRGIRRRTIWMILARALRIPTRISAIRACPWQFNALMRPSDAGFSAIRRDVLRPWAGPRKRTFHGRLGAARGRPTPLGCGSGWTGTSSWRCAAARASALRWSCAPAASQPRKHWARDDGAASASNGAGASGSSM